MKKQIFSTMVLMLSCFLLGSLLCEAQAGCTKKAAGDLYIHYSYKLRSSSTVVHDKIYIRTYEAEGRYNGGCNTPVGRQKARRRACDKIKEKVKKRLEGEFEHQKVQLCRRGVLTENLKRDAEWFQIRFFKLYIYVLKDNGRNDSNNTLNGWIKILAASSNQFLCFVPINPANSAIQRNIDLPGSDYKNMSMRSTNFGECRNACRQDPRCRAWTWVKPGVQGEKAKCWLKDSEPSPQRNTNCVSGIK